MGFVADIGTAVWESFVGFFRRKRILQVHMFDVQGDINVFRRKVREHKFEWKKGLYVVKKERTYITKQTQKPVAFYFEGNPEPLDFTHKKHVFMSAETLYEVVRSDMTKDVYVRDDDKMLLIVLILLVVIVVIGVFNVLVGLHVFGGTGGAT